MKFKDIKIDEYYAIDVTPYRIYTRAINPIPLMKGKCVDKLNEYEKPYTADEERNCNILIQFQSIIHYGHDGDYLNKGISNHKGKGGYYFWINHCHVKELTPKMEDKIMAWSI